MIKQKIKVWLKRYLPAEIVCTLTAIGAASIAHALNKSAIITAYAGSIGESIGFYSIIFIQNIIVADKKQKIANKTFSVSDIPKIIGDIIVEFGPAALMDGLIFRPFFMYLFTRVLKTFTVGIFVNTHVMSVKEPSGTGTLMPQPPIFPSLLCQANRPIGQALLIGLIRPRQKLL